MSLPPRSTLAYAENNVKEFFQEVDWSGMRVRRL